VLAEDAHQDDRQRHEHEEEGERLGLAHHDGHDGDERLDEEDDEGDQDVGGRVLDHFDVADGLRLEAADAAHVAGNEREALQLAAEADAQVAADGAHHPGLVLGAHDGGGDVLHDEGEGDAAVDQQEGELGPLGADEVDHPGREDGHEPDGGVLEAEENDREGQVSPVALHPLADEGEEALAFCLCRTDDDYLPAV
jgi:hypothetical protein